jgi:hypothetical protein
MVSASTFVGPDEWSGPVGGSEYVTITFLVGIVVLLGFATRVAFHSTPDLAVALAVGW